MTDNLYTDLMNAEQGSPEHLDIVAQIKAREVAAFKAEQDTIKGTGRSGHGYASYTVDPGNATPSNVDTYRGPMGVGVGSPNIDPNTINIGGLVTSREVAESLRRTYSAEEWRTLTGLPYESLTANPGLTQEPQDYAKKVMQPTQAELEQQLALEQEAEVKAEQERIAAENAALDYGPSLLEQVISDNYKPEMTDAIVKDVVSSGEINVEALGQLGVTQEMISDAEAHYRSAADAILAPINSCTAYLENMLTEPEAAAARAAIVRKDAATLKQLGDLARNRVASMGIDQVKDFLTADERRKVRLEVVNRQVTVTLPGVGKTSWAAAVNNGWISFQ